MKVFAIFTQENKFIASFPSRTDAVNFGITLFGPEKGWEYDIREMWLYETKQYSFSQPITQPITQPLTTPYTPPTTVPSPPYTPNIWCDVKAPKATYDNGPFAPGTK